MSEVHSHLDYRTPRLECDHSFTDLRLAITRQCRVTSAELGVCGEREGQIKIQ